MFVLLLGSTVLISVCLVGSTVLISLLSHNKLTVANVGDSRGVLCDQDNKAVPLSFDHKPQQVSGLSGRYSKVCYQREYMETHC